MDAKKKSGKRFTLLDAVIILVVLAAVAFVAYKMMPGGSTATYEDVYLSFYAPDVPDFVAEQLYIGAPMNDADRLTPMSAMARLDRKNANTEHPRPWYSNATRKRRTAITRRSMPNSV